MTTQVNQRIGTSVVVKLAGTSHSVYIVYYLIIYVPPHYFAVYWSVQLVDQAAMTLSIDMMLSALPLAESIIQCDVTPIIAYTITHSMQASKLH